MADVIKCDHCGADHDRSSSDTYNTITINASIAPTADTGGLATHAVHKSVHLCRRDTCLVPGLQQAFAEIGKETIEKKDSVLTPPPQRIGVAAEIELIRSMMRGK